MVVRVVCELLCKDCTQFVTLKLAGFSHIPVLVMLCI